MRLAGSTRRNLPPFFIPAGSGNPPALDYESWFKRMRNELPQVHIPQSEAGKPVKAQRHFKEFDDAWDTMWAIAASLSTLERMTQEERAEIQKVIEKERLTAPESRTSTPIQRIRDQWRK